MTSVINPRASCQCPETQEMNLACASCSATIKFKNPPLERPSVDKTLKPIKPMNIMIYIGDTSGIGDYWNSQHDQRQDYLNRKSSYRGHHRSQSAHSIGHVHGKAKLKRTSLERLELCGNCIRCLFCFKTDDTGKKRVKSTSAALQKTSQTSVGSSLMDPYEASDLSKNEYQTIIDMLTVHKVSSQEIKDWCKSFHSLMKSTHGIELFTLFCESEFSIENIKFYTALTSFQSSIESGSLTSTDQYIDNLRRLYDDFISDSSPNQVSLTYSMQQHLSKTLETYHVLQTNDCDHDDDHDHDVISGYDDNNNNINKTKEGTSTTKSIDQDEGDQTEPAANNETQPEEETTLVSSTTNILDNQSPIKKSKIHSDTQDTLQQIKEYIYNVMHRDSYQRFVASPMVAAVKVYYKI